MAIEVTKGPREKPVREDYLKQSFKGKCGRCGTAVTCLGTDGAMVKRDFGSSPYMVLVACPTCEQMVSAF